MNVYLLIILRFVHIIAGVLWGGAAISYLFFVKPSIQSKELISKMQMLEKRLNRAEWIDLAMLTIAMLTMATARYWVF